MKKKLLLSLTLLCFTSKYWCQESTKNRMPNIIFCLADDWGWPHAGVYGDQAVKTPNFDRLANEGVLFNNAYVSSPSCTPSRNAFITGKYHWELGPGANLRSELPAEHNSFIHLLKQQGYITGRTTAKTWGPGRINSWIEQHGEHPGGKSYKTFDEFLENTEAKSAPFFFWLGTKDPHRKYKKGSGVESGIDLSKVHLFKHFPDSDIIRSDVADYYFEVQRWDSLVGSVMAQLERNNLLDNTIIIMTGDHGMPFPRCKGNLYDSGVRVPFAIRWGDQIRPGRYINDFISFTDIAPTLLEIAGVKIPNDMTGKSFLPLLESETSGILDLNYRSEIVFGRERHVPAQEKPYMGGYPSRGYRTHNFLYIRNYKPELYPYGTGKIGSTNYPNQWYADNDNSPTKSFIIEHKNDSDEIARSFQWCYAKRPSEELYDLEKDPDQLINIANDSKYKKILQDLRIKLHGKLSELNDPRADDPNYTGFDNYPFFGNGGAKK